MQRRIDCEANAQTIRLLAESEKISLIIPVAVRSFWAQANSGLEYTLNGSKDRASLEDCGPCESQVLPQRRSIHAALIIFDMLLWLQLAPPPDPPTQFFTLTVIN